MTSADARERAGTAREHLRVAEQEYLTIQGTSDRYASAQVAASNAILAGIAASDAICGKALGERVSEQDHRAAGDFLATVQPGGKGLAVKLRRLLKDRTLLQYGNYCTPSKADDMLRNARALIEALGAHDL